VVLTLDSASDHDSRINWNVGSVSCVEVHKAHLYHKNLVLHPGTIDCVTLRLVPGVVVLLGLVQVGVTRFYLHNGSAAY
jgi:hypothetical protein